MSAKMPDLSKDKIRLLPYSDLNGQEDLTSCLLDKPSISPNNYEDLQKYRFGLLI